MKLIQIMVGTCLVLCLLLVILGIGSKPDASRPVLKIGFVGMTNHIVSGNLAVFTLTNSGQLPVHLIIPGGPELSFGTELKNSAKKIKSNYSGCHELSPGRSLTVNVSASEIHDQWRATFDYWRITKVYRIRRFFSPLLHYLGFQTSVTTLGSSLEKVQSDWMEPTAEINWMSPAWK